MAGDLRTWASAAGDGRTLAGHAAGRRHARGRSIRPLWSRLSGPVSRAEPDAGAGRDCPNRWRPSWPTSVTNSTSGSSSRPASWSKHSTSSRPCSGGRWGSLGVSRYATTCRDRTAPTGGCVATPPLRSVQRSTPNAHMLTNLAAPVASSPRINGRASQDRSEPVPDEGATRPSVTDPLDGSAEGLSWANVARDGWPGRRLTRPAVPNGGPGAPSMTELSKLSSPAASSCGDTTSLARPIGRSTRETTIGTT